MNIDNIVRYKNTQFYTRTNPYGVTEIYFYGFENNKPTVSLVTTRSNYQEAVQYIEASGSTDLKQFYKQARKNRKRGNQK